MLFASLLMTTLAGAVSAQVTPAAGYTPPDDTPSIKVGATIYTDFTYQSNPSVTDADGNTVNPSSFNVARSYINLTGNISHLVAFRITPDVARVVDRLVPPLDGEAVVGREPVGDRGEHIRVNRDRAVTIPADQVEVLVLGQFLRSHAARCARTNDYRVIDFLSGQRSLL